MGRMPLDAMHKNAPASFRVTFRIVIDVPLPVRNIFRKIEDSTEE